MNIVIPMAGAGTRFKESGWVKPKPLYPVCGEPMIKRVIENLLSQLNNKSVRNVIGVATENQHDEIANVYYKNICWGNITPTLITVPTTTRGAVETVLAASKELDPNDSLLTINCDQLIYGNLDMLFYKSNNDFGISGYIQTIKTNDPAYSYVKLNVHGDVVQVEEKSVISTHGTTGLYFWSSTHEFITYANKMIDQYITSKGEFYLAPLYQLMINDGHRISTVEATDMYNLGTPENITNFERLLYANFTHK